MAEKDGIRHASGYSFLSRYFSTCANRELEIFRPFPTNCGLVRLQETLSDLCCLCREMGTVLQSFLVES
jgi:hypothetical protein